MGLGKSRGHGFLLALALAFFSVAGCSSERNFRAIPPGEGPATPRYVDLRGPLQIATVHFPVGTYVLTAQDNGGYYYRSPRPVTKHAFAGLQQYDGGIYLRKGARSKVRGYLVWGGGRTKIGDLSHADYSFRD